MKIRTFMTIEKIDVAEADEAENKFTITNMLNGITVNSLPAKESIVLLLTFDEVEKRKKKLEIVLLNPKDKAIRKWNYEMEESTNLEIPRLILDLEEAGDYTLKISYNEEFLGKYPLKVYIESGGGFES